MMIEQAELRVGNWVRQIKKDLGQLGNVPEAIIRINAYDIHLQDVNSPIEFEPIPLTPEILENIGFIQSTYEWCLPDSDMVLEYSGTTQRWHFSGGEGVKFGIGAKYVHQLQNLFFALTGEELTVNL